VTTDGRGRREEEERKIKGPKALDTENEMEEGNVEKSEIVHSGNVKINHFFLCNNDIRFTILGFLALNIEPSLQ
jgi:hypothetical protein